MPVGTSPTPIVGEHFFGDFQLPYGLAQTQQAYDNSFNPTLPLGFLLFELLTVFSVQTSWLIFTVTTLIMSYIALKITHIGDSEIAKIAPIIILFTSLPIFVAIDRGALVLLSVALYVFSWQNIQRNINKKSNYKDWMYITLLSISLSWKPYLFVLLVLGYQSIKLKKIAKIFLVFFLMNIGSAALFFRPLTTTFKGLVDSYSLQLGSTDLSWLYSGVSINKFILSLHYYFNNRTSDSEFLLEMSKYSTLFGLLYIGLIIILNKFVFQSPNTQFALSLSTCSFVVPVSMSYTLIWTLFAVILILKDVLGRKFKNEREKQNSIILLAGITSLTLPWPTEYYLTLIPGMWLVSLTIIVVLNLTHMIIGRKSLKRSLPSPTYKRTNK
jgi:hypothetical protein